MERVYAKPVWRNQTNLSDKAVKWFMDRGISPKTIEIMKIGEGMEVMPQTGKLMNTVQFNYFRNGELVNVKYRSGKKDFKLHKDAELILYNLDAIKDSTELLICEGEMDQLSFQEAGYAYAVSVPNGATTNLQYIDNCYEYFENKEKIYISTDNDTKGLVLRDELIRRLGAERCWLINLKDCKDANEYLVKYGSAALTMTISDAIQIPVEGVITIDLIEDKLDELYKNGLPQGHGIGYDNLDRIVRFTLGRLMVVTGIPGHGKSEFIDELVERLNILYGWKAGYFSPENHPLELHASKILEKLTGKHFQSRDLPLPEYEHAKLHFSQNFYFIYPKDEATDLDTILEKGLYLIRRFGIKILVIDPWNRLEHMVPPGVSETNYISRELDKITMFCQRNNVLIILVAHPKKMGREDGKLEKPTLYDINGSAAFFNKCDYGISVYRDRSEETTQIHVQKVRFKNLGQPGMAEFKYNIDNGRFSAFDKESIAGHKNDNSNHITSGIGVHPQVVEPEEEDDSPFERV
jgi:twinkle protein